MKRNIAPEIAAATFVAFAVWATTAKKNMPSLPVVHADGMSGCSTETAAGKWGFTTNGTVGGVGPRDSLGIFTLDSAGRLVNGKATASLNGMVTDETFSGTYSANPDCTGKLAIQIFDLWEQHPQRHVGSRI